MFRELTAVCSENDMKPANQFCGQNSELMDVEANGDVPMWHQGLSDFKLESRPCERKYFSFR
jgi:hypothetical protein